MGRALVVFGTASVVSLAACGIDAIGVGPVDADAAAPAPVPSGADGADGGGGSEACLDVPEGFRVVGVVAAGVDCPAGAIARTYLEGPAAGDTPCTCTCGAPKTNPCEYPMKKTHEFKAGVDGSACVETATITIDRGCMPGDYNVKSVTALASPALPPESVECAAEAHVPAIASTSRIDACEGETAACIPVGQRACIAHAGELTECPQGFPSRTVVTELADLEDTRTCGACSCTSRATSCTNASLTLYTDAACKSGARTAIFDDTCRPFDSTSFSPKSAEYHATPVPADCAPGSPTAPLSGAVTSKAKTTLCCAL